jgi:putative Mg2+ transporter-C (MgtC) family protein
VSSLSAIVVPPTIGWPEVLLRLFVAAALGGAIGLERELRERQAGLRTHLVVCVGSALFTLVSAYGFSDRGVRVDPTRIAAQIVTGIGFLGAGAIIRQGLSVRGLTTAATLWLVAAIGLASGAGYYSAAVITTLVALISLWPLRIATHLVITRFRPESGRLLVQLPIGESPGPLVTAVEQLGVKLHTLEISQEGDRRNVLLDVELPKGAEATDVVAKLAEVEHVLGARWTD